MFEAEVNKYYKYLRLKGADKNVTGYANQPVRLFYKIVLQVG